MKADYKSYVFIFYFFYFYFFKIFIYLFIYGCAGSSLLREGFLQLRQAGATPHCGARAPHRRGLSCCGAQAPDAQAQQLWLTGPVAPRHVGSSQTRARTRVPCTGRWTLNHCATREALLEFIFNMSIEFLTSASIILISESYLFIFFVLFNRILFLFCKYSIFSFVCILEAK